MRTSQGLDVLRVSQEPLGPPPAAQPRVAERSHSHNMPASARPHRHGTRLSASKLGLMKGFALAK